MIDWSWTLTYLLVVIGFLAVYAIISAVFENKATITKEEFIDKYDGRIVALSSITGRSYEECAIVLFHIYKTRDDQADQEQAVDDYVSRIANTWRQ